MSSFAIGALGVTVFHLGFVDGLLTILFINLLGITPVCFFSTFGPRYGLRQMVLSRFFFGYHAVKVSKYTRLSRRLLSDVLRGHVAKQLIVAFFNILACVGWSAVNVIVGAQLLNAVNSNLPGYAGIIIIAACTFIITCFGYKVVHMYEMYSWIPCFIVFLIVLGEFAHSGDFQNLTMHTGNAEAGSVLSFMASVYGFATGWTSYAADYTVYQPATVSRTKTFLWTWLGLIFPLCFTEMLGLAVATATVGAEDNPYIVQYNKSHIGGLLAAVLFPPLGRFGQFCLVILALSIIGNNCPNIYSVTFSLQIMGRWTQHVPRFLWTFVGTLIYCAIAIPGYSRFEQVLENFMLLIVIQALIVSYTYDEVIVNMLSGVLAGHLRGYLPDGALRLRQTKVRHHRFQYSVTTSAGHSSFARFLLRYLGRSHGHGPAVVYRTYRQKDWASRVRR